MFGLPTHIIYLINNDGERENVMMTDCSSKKEIRNEIKYLFTKCNYDINKYSDYFMYCNSNDVVLYNGTISECLEEK